MSRSTLSTLIPAKTMSDYYTPLPVIKSAKKFFGGAIDLDICSDHVANTIVEAKTFLTDFRDFAPRQSHDLSIWCNPPYERNFITHFFCDWYVKHIPIAVENGCEILTLVNTQSSAKWFHSLLHGSDSIGFFKQRISFIHPQTLLPVSGNRYDQTLFMSSPKLDSHLRLLEAFGTQAKIIRLM